LQCTLLSHQTLSIRGPWPLCRLLPASIANGCLLFPDGFILRCFQDLSINSLAARLCNSNRCTRGCEGMFLSYLSLLPVRRPTPSVDSDRTVSRRSEPS